MFRLLGSGRSILLFVFLLWAPGNSAVAQHAAALAGLHRVYSGTVNGFDVWIVDGNLVRERIIPQFLYGGNPQEYPTIPANEIWIDHAITSEEYEYTLRHELCERELMAAHGWTYGAAHDSALMLEQKLRRDDLRVTQEHERRVPKVGTADYYGEKEIAGLGDSVRLGDIYRVYVGKRDSLDVWIVDGAAIRRDIYPDFGLSGNDLAYHYIPPGEIWLDAQISCEEMEYSIRFELAERAFIGRGLPYDDAYEKALMLIRNERIAMSRKAAKLLPLQLSNQPLQK